MSPFFPIQRLTGHLLLFQQWYHIRLYICYKRFWHIQNYETTFYDIQIRAVNLRDRFRQQKRKSWSISCMKSMWHSCFSLLKISFLNVWIFIWLTIRTLIVHYWFVHKELTFPYNTRKSLFICTFSLRTGYQMNSVGSVWLVQYESYSMNHTSDFW